MGNNSSLLLFRLSIGVENFFKLHHMGCFKNGKWNINNTRKNTRCKKDMKNKKAYEDLSNKRIQVNDIKAL